MFLPATDGSIPLRRPTSPPLVDICLVHSMKDGDSTNIIKKLMSCTGGAPSFVNDIVFFF
jgi:hypothetical protein